MSKPLYGFYSEKQARYGTNFYATPEGGEVEITEVGPTADGATPNVNIKPFKERFSDGMTLGPVGAWIRTGRPRITNYFGMRRRFETQFSTASTTQQLILKP